MLNWHKVISKALNAEKMKQDRVDKFRNLQVLTMQILDQLEQDYRTIYPE